MRRIYVNSNLGIGGIIDNKPEFEINRKFKVVFSVPKKLYV